MNEKLILVLNQMEEKLDKLSDANEIPLVSYFQIGELINQAKKLISE